MPRQFCLAVLLGLLASTATARAAAPPVNILRTVHYDIADIIYKPGGKTGLDTVEEVVRVIIDATGPQYWSATGKGSATLEINGTRLEVRARARQHEDVRDILRALRGLIDVNVDVRSELLEVDRAHFDKKLKPRLAGKGVFALAIGPEDDDDDKVDDTLPELRKHSKILKSTKTRLANGRAGTALSFRKAFTYATTPSGLRKAAGGNFKVAFTGLTVKTKAVVSADRRFVRLQLQQETADLVAIKKKAVMVPPIGKLGTVESPEIVESASSTTVTVGDGCVALMPVHARLGRAAARDKVLVLLIQPLLYIEEEEKERARQANQP
jgi:hypothetical protein